MVKKVIICFCLLIYGMLSMLSAEAFERLNFGNGFISDNANIISIKDEIILNSLIWKLHKNTTADIAVVTVNSLEHQRAEETAFYIAKAFRVGAIGKDNGIVFVIAPHEEQSAIYVGYDFENKISSARIQQIQDLYIKDNLKDNKTISNSIYKATTILIADAGEYYNTIIDGLDYSYVPKPPIDNTVKYSIFYYILAFIMSTATIRLWIINNKRKTTFNASFAFGGSVNPLKNW